MEIKKYLDFIKESSDYEYGCVMLDIPFNNWEEVCSIINKDDLYTEEGNSTYGIQKYPHATLLYGLHNNVTSESVKDILMDVKPITIEIDGIDLFENDKYDVVKFNVKNTDILQNTFDSLSTLPNSNSYKDYKPHITIAYVKKGEGKKYIKDYNDKIESSKICYSHADGSETFFNLGTVYESLNENKMWYKTIPEILKWIESKSKMPWLWVDTETTGLKGPKQEQLTQVSSIATKYDYKSNTFTEIGMYDQKIKLTSDIKNRYNTDGDDSRRILSFNHYGSGKYKYREEREIVDEFFDWMNNYSPCLLIAQNAGFDMRMLGGRYSHKIENEVFDTKMLIQLYFLPLIQKLAENDTKYKEMVSNIGVSERDNGLISSSMSKVGPVLGIDMSGYHDALTDCRLTIEMYKKIVDILKQYKDEDIMKYQVERIKIIRNK